MTLAGVCLPVRTSQIRAIECHLYTAPSNKGSDVTDVLPNLPVQRTRVSRCSSHGR